MRTKGKNLFARRTISMTLVCLLLLTSCGGKNITTPYTLHVNGKTISYTDTKTDIEEALGKGTPIEILFNDGYDYNSQVNVQYNDDDKTRYIEVVGNKVNTINNIKVGDNIEKVLKMYNYINERSSNYSVVFNGKDEMDQTSINKDESIEKEQLTWITYFTDENELIDKIAIFDQEFANYMK